MSNCDMIKIIFNDTAHDLSIFWRCSQTVVNFIETQRSPSELSELNLCCNLFYDKILRS